MTLEERREKNFQAKIEFEDGEHYLKVTHNGYQWSCIPLNYNEMQIVISLLNEEIRNKETN